MWLFSWFVSHGYTPFRGPLLVASSNRDLASSASLLVLGPPVIGVRWLLLLVVIAPFRVFCLALVRYLLGIVWWGWVHPWWAAGVLLFWFTSGFTRVGVRWLVLLVVMPLLECSAWHSSDTCLVLYHGVGSTRVGRRACCFSLLFTEFGASRNFYMASPPYSSPPLPFHVRFPPHTMALPMCCGPGAHLPHTALLIMLI